MFGIASFSQAPFSSLAGRTVEASAAITADAFVTASATRFRTSAASINVTATITVTTLPLTGKVLKGAWEKLTMPNIYYSLKYYFFPVSN